MYVHAYQSYVWNVVVSERIRVYGYDRPVAGDLVFLRDTDDTSEDILMENAGGDSVAAPSDEVATGPETDQADETSGLGITEPHQNSSMSRRVFTAFTNVDLFTLRAKQLQRYQRGRQESLCSAQGQDSRGIRIEPIQHLRRNHATSWSRCGVPRRSTGRALQRVFEGRRTGPRKPTTRPQVSNKSWVHWCCTDIISSRDYTLLGSYRKILHLPEQISWSVVRYTDPDVPLAQSDEDKILGFDAPKTDPEGKFMALQIHLQLGTAAYATMALREVTKTDTSSQSQTLLTLASEDQAFKGSGGSVPDTMATAMEDEKE